MMTTVHRMRCRKRLNKEGKQMSHDDFDDGLVHSHGWATEPPAPTQRHVQVIRTHVADDHDDGLVHGHAWAMGTPME